MPDSTAEQPPKDLIGFLDYYLVKKAPFQIPDAGRELLVKFGPWIILLMLVLSLPALLLILGVGTALVPFGGVEYATGFGLGAIFLIVLLGLEAAALPGLFARKMSGWTLLFYARIVSFVYALVSSLWALIPAIIGLVIGLYLLFQVRSLYK